MTASMNDKTKTLVGRLRNGLPTWEERCEAADKIASDAILIEAQAARIEETDHALDLAESIVASMPSNGGNWNLLQRFGATLSKYRALFKDNDHG